jgi:hypothetical protein
VGGEREYGLSSALLRGDIRLRDVDRPREGRGEGTECYLPHIGGSQTSGVAKNLESEKGPA